MQAVTAWYANVLTSLGAARKRGLISLVRPAGRTDLEVEVLYTLDTEKC